MELNRKELFHPLFYLIFIAIGSSYSLYEIFKNNLKENIKLIPFIIFAYIIYQILDASESVKIKNAEIISGILINPIGFVKIKDRILIKDISEFTLYQNERKYFEIRAVTKSKEFLIIKTLANKIPAEKEMEEITKKIKNVG
jgi:hypothetical protein